MTRPRQASLLEHDVPSLQLPLNDPIERLPTSWRNLLQQPALAQTLHTLNDWLTQRQQAGAVMYPPNPFRMLELTAAEAVKVVILGQDPYHGPNQARGLAFSVPNEQKTPPSLRNMFKELAREYPEQPVRTRNELSDWAAQGVLLLNTVLTVEHKLPASHAKQGWERVTDTLIDAVLEYPRPKVFLLWGAHAQAKRERIEAFPHAGPVLCLSSNHPSPLSAARPPVPFLGNGHFRAANEWLVAQGEVPIQWLAELSL